MRTPDRALARRVKRRGRAVARFAQLALLDLSDWLARSRGPLTPPRRLSHFVGEGDFQEIGAAFLRYFVEFGGLTPSDRVLDVGCGVGRMAVPLTGYLDPPGNYEGIDIVPKAISWCRQAITPRFSGFCFHLADIQNAMYNPCGRLRAQEYRFPFADGEFDFVLLTSVFTHLLPVELDHYVAESARVLRNGGTCFATAFLLDDESRASLAAGRSLHEFRHGSGPYRTTDEDVPESAVAYDDAYLRGVLRSHGLELEDPVRQGYWSGGAGPDHQDILIAHRRT
jgi:SAM-dependent methyltransferase